MTLTADEKTDTSRDFNDLLLDLTSRLAARVDAIDRCPTEDFEKLKLAAEVYDRIASARARLANAERGETVKGAPCDNGNWL